MHIARRILAQRLVPQQEVSKSKVESVNNGIVNADLNDFTYLTPSRRSFGELPKCSNLAMMRLSE